MNVRPSVYHGSKQRGEKREVSGRRDAGDIGLFVLFLSTLHSGNADEKHASGERLRIRKGDRLVLSLSICLSLVV